MNRAWRESIDSLTRRIAAARGDVAAPLNVNIVFQIPGDILQPEFEGVRTGSFAKTKSLLMIQVAVPAAVPDNLEQYLLHVTHTALDEAERWARKRRVAADIQILREIVDRAAHSGPAWSL